MCIRDRVENGEILVTRPNDDKQARSLHGLTRSLLNNMVEGVVTVSYTHLDVYKRQRYDSDNIS